MTEYLDDGSMTQVMRLAEMTPEMVEVVVALKEAAATATGEPFDAEGLRRIARRARAEHQALVLEEQRARRAEDFPYNPYIHERYDRHARWRFLDRNERMDRFYTVSRDLRTEVNNYCPLSIPVRAKRRWRWAVESFLDGYLSGVAFYHEIRHFDEAVAVAMDEGFGRPLETIEREERRLRRHAARGYIDRRAWFALAQRKGEKKEAQERWELEHAMATERRRQMALLRQGRETLTAIRKWLRDPVSSRLPESRPAKTSPTS